MTAQQLERGNKVNNQPLVSDLLGEQKVVPVVVIENEEQAHGLAKALLAGGVTVIEVTLRNAYGIKAIELMKQHYPEMVVLAGTVNTPNQVASVVKAGVDGVISPGITRSLIEAAQQQVIPYLPGVATASEVLLAIEYGLRECKLFPATVVGGIGALKALNGPFPNMKFCPTGGVSEGNYMDFMALPNVMCVGGSWIAPSNLVAEQNWSEITTRCKTVVQS